MMRSVRRAKGIVFTRNSDGKMSLRKSGHKANRKTLPRLPRNKFEKDLFDAVEDAKRKDAKLKKALKKELMERFDPGGRIGEAERFVKRIEARKKTLPRRARSVSRRRN